jgi:hypothetical protein
LLERVRLFTYLHCGSRLMVFVIFLRLLDFS